jgi:hypothetical protein
VSGSQNCKVPPASIVAIAGQALEVWDVDSGARRWSLRGHGRGAAGVAFDNNGRLAAACADAVKLWDLGTGEEVLTLRDLLGQPKRVAFSPDGRRLAAMDQVGVAVWDAREATDAVRTEREAAAALRVAFAQGVLKEKVADRLHADSSVSEPARLLALGWLELYRDEPVRNDDAAWAIVRAPGQSPEQYQQALRLAQSACRQQPYDGLLLNTLGVAQYRVGCFADAVDTLSKSEKLNKGDPADLAFLAMAQHGLGQTEPARATLSRLRETMKLPRWANNAEAKGFLSEAEAVVDPSPVHDREKQP